MFHWPAYAPELDPVEGVRSLLKRSLSGVGVSAKELRRYTPIFSPTASRSRSRRRDRCRQSLTAHNLSSPCSAAHMSSPRRSRVVVPRVIDARGNEKVQRTPRSGSALHRDHGVTGQAGSTDRWDPDREGNRPRSRVPSAVGLAVALAGCFTGGAEHSADRCLDQRTRIHDDKLTCRSGRRWLRPRAD